MSRNIKEIGKELLGKSLNSFHRKTGLTQLEKNNEMQDGILNGILSQVDDAYIEKTEQSNVIHLDGSGDGVVVLDSIEGNTLVNILGDGFNTPSNYVHNDWGHNNSLTFDGDWVTVNSIHEWSGLMRYSDTMPLKPSTVYTLIIEVKENTLSVPYQILHASNNVFKQDNTRLDAGFTGIKKFLFTTCDDLSNRRLYQVLDGRLSTNTTDKIVYRQILLEGDWRDKEVPYFNSLQSSFEEQVEEDKYKIEILSQNNNLFNKEVSIDGYILSSYNNSSVNASWFHTDYIKVKKGSYFMGEYKSPFDNYYCHFYDLNKNYIASGTQAGFRHNVCTFDQDGYVRLSGDLSKKDLGQFKYNTISSNYLPHKQNKIKLLLNEPLRGLPNGTKDELCIKDDKLVIKRKCGETTLNSMSIGYTNGTYLDIFNLGAIGDKYNVKTQSYMTCDKFPYVGDVWNGCQAIGIGGHNNVNFRITYPKETMTVDSLTQWLQNNQTTVIYELAEPTYEEVLNEYGEPILLEGYENGTLYIDSAIVPTTTVRYTPKMESFKTLKEVNNNNIMLTNDIDDNIIPYMMDVDLMIMEKEMALMSQYKIRRMGAKDMTSMQKRTQDMLTRLIKGKTLTEQECKTRVTTYLNAGKITDEQAKELNFLIDEIYA